MKFFTLNLHCKYSARCDICLHSALKNSILARTFASGFFYISKKFNTETTNLEAEIDGLVYELYGLSEEEKKVVEGKN